MLYDFLRGRSKPRRLPTKLRRRRDRRLSLENLESRQLLATDVWLGTTNDWNTPSNWSLGYVPGPGDIAEFPDTATVKTVDLGGNTVTVSGLSFVNSIGNNFTLQSGTIIASTLTQSGTGDNDITATLDESSLAFVATLSAGSLRLSKTANSLGTDDVIHVNSGATLVSLALPGSTIGTAEVNLNGGQWTLDIDVAASFIAGGLDGNYYSTTAAQSLLDPISNLKALTPTATAITPRIDFGTGTESLPGDGSVLDRGGTGGNPFGGLGINVGTDNIAGLWQGYIFAPEDADYRFTTRSDDGSRLFIDGTLVVDNNFFQGMTNRNGTIHLTPGYHQMEVGYYEGGGGSGMQASWEQLTGATPFGRKIIEPSSLNRLTATSPPANNVTVSSSSSINLASLVPSATLGNLAVSNGQTLTLNSADGGQSLVFTGNTSLGGAASFNTNNLAKLTLNNISETAAASLTKLGTGTLILPTANSYSGLTTISNGVLQISANNALGTIAAGTIVSSSGALKLSGGVAYSSLENLQISGAGNTTVGAALSSGGGNASFAGPITLGSAAQIQAEDNTLTLPGGIDNNGSTVTFTGAGSVTVNTLGISGAGGLVKSGSGNLVLNTANAYGGQTTINAGRIIARDSNALGSTAAATLVNGGGQLRLENNVSIPTAEVITINGNGPNNEGALRNQSGNNTAQSVVLGSAAWITSNSGTLSLPNGLNLAGALTVAGNGNIDVPGLVSGASGITRIDGGTLILSNGGNSFGGAVNINGGRVQVRASGALGSIGGGTIVSSGGTLEFDGAFNYVPLEPISIAGDGVGGVGALNKINGSGILPMNIALTSSATIGSGTAGSKLTLNGALSLPLVANLGFTGAGDIDVTQAFGNGNVPLTGPYLAQSWLHSTDIAGNLDAIGTGAGNGGLISATKEGSNLLAGPLNFNAGDFAIASGVLGFNEDNIKFLWSGQINVTADGVYRFGVGNVNGQVPAAFGVDDDFVVYVDRNKDHIFKDDANPSLNERLYRVGCCPSVNSMGSGIALAAGTYDIAFGFSNGGGGRYVGAVYSANDGANWQLVNPAAGVVANTSFSYTITPANAVTKSGSGTVTLLGNNTYNGATTINAGTLVAANNNALGSAVGGTTVAAGARLLFDGGINYSTPEPIVISGNGVGGSVGNLSGVNSFSGPISIATASTPVLGSFTGGDSGEGLDLDGDFKYAVNVRGPGGLQIRDALFTDEASQPNVVISAPAEILNWQNPSFGATTNDDNLEVVMQSIRHGGANPGVINATLNGLTVGAPYKLQLLIYENNPNRRTDVLFDGKLLAHDYTGGIANNVGGVFTYEFLATATQHTVSLNGTTTSTNYDRNPVLQGITLEQNTGFMGASGAGNLVSLDGTLTLSGQVNLDASTVNISGAGQLIVNGNVVGVGVATNLNKSGLGTTTLAGGNTYLGTTTVSQGVLIAANNAALGSSLAGTTVANGATLGLQGGVTINGEALTINGTGAAGQPGALVNISGNNTIAVGSPIVAQVVSLGQIGIGSTTGSLTINSNIDLKSSKLISNGAGATIINGTVSGTGVDVPANPAENVGAATGVFANVPEANNYILTYELTAVNGVNGADPFPYTRDNTATVQPFDRIAYYLELDSGAGLQYVYVSMDAFTNNLNQIGIPNGASLFKWQQFVSNMNVFSNKAGITTGTGIATGNIEIWPSNYGTGNDIGVPNANGGTYDFGDGGSNANLGYGSFQIHNYDLDGAGPGTAGQVLLAYNNWRSGAGDLGIGNQVGGSGHPDYTFANNLPGYTVKRMAILVHETTSRLIQTDNSLIKTGSGSLALNTANTYIGTTTVSQGTLLVGHPDALSSGNVSINDANTGSNNTSLLATFADAGNSIANNIIVANQGTGTTTIGTTTFNAGSVPTLFDGTLTLNKATTFQGGNADRTTYTNVISGTPGAITVSGGARTTWQATNLFTGNVQISGAGSILQIGAGGASSNVIPDASNVDVGAGAFFYFNTGAESINTLSGTGTVQKHPSVGGATVLSVGANNGTGSFGGVITNGNGTLGIAKIGTGTQTLTNSASSYTGNTIINAGSLNVPDVADGGANSPLGAGTTIQFGGGILSYTAGTADSSNRTITLSAGRAIINTSNAAGALTFSGTLNGGGQSFNKTGPGSLTLTGSTAVGQDFNTLYAAGGNLILGNGANIKLSGASGSVGVGKNATNVTGGGAGLLTIQTGSTLTLSGELLVGDDNSQAGTVNQTGGTVSIGNRVRLGHWPSETSNYNLSGGSLTVTNALNVGWDGTGIFTQTGGTASASSVVVDANGAGPGGNIFDLQGGVFTVGSGGITSVAPVNATIKLGGLGGTLKAGASFSSSLAMTLTGSGANAVNIDSNGNSISLTGALGGSGDLNKIGAGTLTMGAVNTYTGVTTINGGTLLVNGSLANGVAADDVVVNNTGTLGGTGAINGVVVVNAGGSITGGTLGGVGALIINNNLSFNGGTYRADINGSTSDSLVVSGVIDLANTAAGSFAINSQTGTPTDGNVFTLINNTAAGAIVDPSLTGAIEGSSTTIGGKTAYYTYAGGDGNNFTLTVVGGPTLAGAGSLEVRRVINGLNDNVQLLQAGVVIDSRPLSGITGTYTVNGISAADSLLINYSNVAPASGFIPLNITFNGGAGGNDTLRILGGDFDAINHTFTNANDGSIVMDPTSGANTTITYTGLEPVLMNVGTVADVVFNLPAGADTAILEDDAGAIANTSQIRSVGGTFEVTSFTHPTGSLTVNGGAGDSITVATSEAFTTASVNLTGADSVAIASLVAGGNANWSAANSISQAGPFTISGNITLTTTGPAAPVTLFNAGNQIGGEVTLTATGNAQLRDSLGAFVFYLTNVGGNLTVQSDGGNIQQTGVFFTINGTASFTATGLNDDIILDNLAPTNDFIGAVSLFTNGPTGNASISDRNSLNLGASNVGGTVNAVAQAGTLVSSGTVIAGGLVTLQSMTGAITDTNGATLNVSAPTLSAFAATGIDLDTSVATLSAVNSTSGSILIDEANAVTLQNVTNNNSLITINTLGAGNITAQNVNAGTGNINITLANGDLFSDGDAAADIVGNSVTLQANGGSHRFGLNAANRLQIDAVMLKANIPGNGFAYIVDKAGGLIMDNSSVGGAANTEFDLLVENGSLVSAPPPTTRDVGATIIILKVTGVTSTIGLSTDAFQINTPIGSGGAMLRATSDGGSIYITDLSDGLAVDVVNANGGDVSLQTIGEMRDVNGAAVNVFGTNMRLVAVAGIGPGNALEINASRLAASNSSTGAIEIVNTSGGLLTLGTVNGVSGVNNNGNGAVDIVNNAGITVANNSSATTNFTLTTSETAATTEHITVNSGVTVQADNGFIDFNAGDNFSVPAGATLIAAGNVTLDSIDTGVDPLGSVFDFFGNVNAANIAFNGSNTEDTFNIQIDDNTHMDVDGNDPTTPTLPGDVLNIFGANLTLVVNGVGTGNWGGPGLSTLDYVEIETVTASGPYHLAVDMSAPGLTAYNSVDAVLDASNSELELRVDVDDDAREAFGGVLAFNGDVTNIRSLRVIGSSAGEVFSITQNANNLLPGQTGGLNNSVPFGPSLGGTFVAAGRTPQAVNPAAILFSASGGNDSLRFNLNLAENVGFFANGAGSGDANVQGKLTVSFNGTEKFESDQFATGGSIIVDSSSFDALATLAITDQGTFTRVAGDNGFTVVEFQSAGAVTIRSGYGQELIDLVSINANGLTSVTLDADNFTNTDNPIYTGLQVPTYFAADTIRVRSLPNVPALLLGGQGGDLFQLFNGSDQTSTILGPITINGEDGNVANTYVDNDRLVMIASGDVGPANVLVTETTIQGLTGFAGLLDVSYSNIDYIDITTTAGDDNIVVDMDNVISDMNIATVRGAGGQDDFDVLGVENFVPNSPVLPQFTDLFLFGDGPDDQAQGDIFGKNQDIFPSLTVVINIRGGLPTPVAPAGNIPGDTLFLDMSLTSANATTPVLIDTVGKPVAGVGYVGSATSASHKPVLFNDIETFDVNDRVFEGNTDSGQTNVQRGDLYVRGQETAADRIILYHENPGVLPPQSRLRYNNTDMKGFINQLPTQTSLGKFIAYGRGGNDQITVSNSLIRDAELFGQLGNDYLAGSSNGGNDLLVGNSGDDRLQGLAGNDIMWGDNQDGTGNGRDRLNGGNGNDVLYGGGGIDYMYGEGGDDIVRGEDGNDILGGDLGNDIVLGGDGNDRINGGAGRDILIGGLGVDTVDGDSGEDIVIGDASTWDIRSDANDVALKELLFGTMASLNYWNNLASPYATRVSQLRSQISGNVFEDANAKDRLIGDGDLDWFWDISLNDAYTGKQATETQN